MVGKSSAFLAVRERLERFARSHSPVLITGETGTGKEVGARYLHQRSRPHGPFVALNCAAVPESMIEAELFGHTKGAFTGALYPRAGKFQAAHGGTLFLDEIGECSLFMQAKLLRVIQEQEISPVGSDTAVSVNARIVAATNKSLVILTTERKFREDLYYRLNVLTAHIPPLRERREDIPLFLEACRQEFGFIESITPEALQALVAYPWPGNIRELRNVMEQCAIMADEPLLRLDALPPHLQTTMACPSYALKLPDAGFSLREALAEIETRFILQALARSHGNKTEAARMLDIPRPTLSHRMRFLRMTGGHDDEGSDEQRAA